MSAPDTNTHKQEKEHKPSLLGIKGAMLFAVLAVLVVTLFMWGNGRDADIGSSAVQDTSGNSEAYAPASRPETPIAPDDTVTPGANENNKKF